MCKNCYDSEKKWREKGEYYGYPPCCIEYFINKEPGVFTNEELEVLDGNGFIPCPGHSTEIKAGIITLEKLITNRKCPTPYPIGDL